MGYTLRVPFETAHEVIDVKSVDGLPFLGRRLRLEKGPARWLIAYLGAFDSPDEAKHSGQLLWAGVAWVMTKTHNGFKMHIDDDPPLLRRDGAILRTAEGTTSYVLEDGAHATYLYALPSTCELLTPLANLAPYFRKAAHVERWRGLDQRVMAALRLLSDCHFAVSERLKLVLCVTALEVLADRIKRHDLIRGVLDNAVGMLRALVGDDFVRQEAKDMEEELHRQKRKSLTKAVQALAVEAYAESTEGEKAEWQQRARSLYDVRSRMVHDGSPSDSEVSRAGSDAYAILTAVLLRRLEQDLSW